MARRCCSSEGCWESTNLVCWACGDGTCLDHSALRPWSYGAEGRGSGKKRPHRICHDCQQAWDREGPA